MSALSPSHQPTVSFSIYQNNTWTIRRLVDETNDPATQRIMLKIVGFLIGTIVKMEVKDKKSMCKRCKDIPIIFYKRCKEIPTILRGIASIDLTFKASNVIEKLIWSAIGLFGVFWAIYFISYLVTVKNPITFTNLEVKLSDMKYPAMTICSKTSTKFAIAERMGNYLNGNSKKLKHLLNIYTVAMTFFSNSDKKNANYMYFEKYKCRRSERKDVCKVCS